MTRSNFELAQIADTVETADMGIIIGVAVAAVFVICLIGFLLYRFILDPHQSNEKESFIDDNEDGYRAHYVGAEEPPHYNAR
jgi:hypothetical protein